MLAMLFFLSCNNIDHSSPLDNLQGYTGKLKDFSKASGQFYAVRYHIGNGLIDTVRVVVINGVITGISKNNGPSYDANYILNSQGKSIKREGGSILKIFADYLQTADNNIVTQPNNLYNENDDREYEGSEEQKEDLLREQKESNAVKEQIQDNSQDYQTNNTASTKEEMSYYKISCDPNWGVKTLKCQKSNNSIGESCREIGSLRGYGQCIGAFIWDQGYKLGGVMWTKNKLVYEAYEGSSNSGSWVMYEISSNKMGTEEITYCTPKGNQIEIHTTSGVIYR